MPETLWTTVDYVQRIEVVSGLSRAVPVLMRCDDDDVIVDDNHDEYTNLYNLCFLLFLFIYSSPSISFSFLHYTLVVLIIDQAH